MGGYLKEFDTSTDGHLNRRTREAEELRFPANHRSRGGPSGWARCYWNRLPARVKASAPTPSGPGTRTGWQSQAPNRSPSQRA